MLATTSGGSSVSIRFLQPEMSGERKEVAISVEQGQTVLDAPCRDQGVDGLPGRDSPRSKQPQIIGCLDGEVVPDEVDVIEGVQHLPDPIELPIVTHPLQDLRSGAIAAIPEPAEAALFAMGIAGLMLARRRVRSSRSSATA